MESVLEMGLRFALGAPGVSTALVGLSSSTSSTPRCAGPSAGRWRRRRSSGWWDGAGLTPRFTRHRSR